MKAITIRQPWASLIAHGIKDVENRTWKCPKRYIGERVLVHSSLAKSDQIISRVLKDKQYSLFRERFGHSGLDFLEPKGAIIGSVEIVECVLNHSSIWAERSETGQCDITNQWLKPIYNWVLSNPILFDEPILNVKGKLGFWNYEFEEETFECTNKNPYTYRAEGQRQGCIQHCDDCEYWRSKYDK